MSSTLVETPGVLRPMLRLVIPVLVEQTLHMLVGFSDTILAGRYLSQSELAAMGMLNYVLWATETCFAVIAVGSTALVARSVGAGDAKSARTAMHQSLLLGAALCAALMLVGFAFVDHLVALLGLHGDAAQFAARFMRFILAVLPAIMLEVIGIACFRGAGDTVAGLIIMLTVNVINVTISWSLVSGVEALGIPRLGWDGLAIGTSIGYAFAGLLVLAMLFRGRAGLRLRWSELRPRRDMLRRLLHVGLPGGGDQMSIVCCHLAYVRTINGLGSLATAAHGVGVRIESISYLPGFAFQIAAQTLVGQFLGARDPRRAGHSVLVTLLVGGGFMVSAGVVLMTMPESLTRIFVNERETDVMALTSRLLPIVGMSMPALACVSILGGALRGAGDTRLPLVFTFVGLLLIRLPGSYLLAYDTIDVPLVGTISGWNLGVVGAWYAMVADVAVRCMLIVGRFWQGGWKKVRV